MWVVRCFESIPICETPKVIMITSTLALATSSNGKPQDCTLSALSEVSRVQEIVCDRMEELKYASRDIFHVRLALDESLTNAIRHGNRMDESKQVRFSFSVNEERVWMEVEDEGDGFDPAKVPDPTDPEFLDRPGGRGVHCIREFMCSVNYSDRGNRVTMQKTRTATNGRKSI